MSRHSEELAAIEEARCPACYGSGTCNDAEPGDMSYNEWTCTECDGSGYAKSAAKDKE